MFIYLYKKIKLKKLKNKVKNGNHKIEIVGNFECTTPDNINLKEYIYIGPNNKFYGTGKINIEENVIIGNDVTILTTNHNYEGELIPYDSVAINKDVTIHENVWIASNCLILPGVEIGEGAILAGGSVLTKNIPPCEIWGGNPAKFIKKRNIEKYSKLKNEKKQYLNYKWSDKIR